MALSEQDLEALMTELVTSDRPDVRDYVVNQLIELENSVGWQIMMEQLRREAAMATETWSTVNPEDVAEVRRLQNLFIRYNWFGDTLAELIQSHVAEDELAGAEADETDQDA